MARSVTKTVSRQIKQVMAGYRAMKFGERVEALPERSKQTLKDATVLELKEGSLSPSDKDLVFRFETLNYLMGREALWEMSLEKMVEALRKNE